MDPYLPTHPHPAERCVPHPAFISKILWNHKFYRVSLDSHQMDVKFLIQSTEDVLACQVVYH